MLEFLQLVDRLRDGAQKVVVELQLLELHALAHFIGQVMNSVVPQIDMHQAGFVCKMPRRHSLDVHQSKIESLIFAFYAIVVTLIVYEGKWISFGGSAIFESPREYSFLIFVRILPGPREIISQDSHSSRFARLFFRKILAQDLASFVGLEFLNIFLRLGLHF